MTRSRSVVSLNANRRNLTRRQRAIAATELWDLASTKDGRREGRSGALGDKAPLTAEAVKGGGQSLGDAGRLAEGRGG